MDKAIEAWNSIDVMQLPGQELSFECKHAIAFDRIDKTSNCLARLLLEKKGEGAYFYAAILKLVEIQNSFIEQALQVIKLNRSGSNLAFLQHFDRNIYDVQSLTEFDIISTAKSFDEFMKSFSKFIYSEHKLASDKPNYNYAAMERKLGKDLLLGKKLITASKLQTIQYQYESLGVESD